MMQLLLPFLERFSGKARREWLICSSSSLMKKLGKMLKPNHNRVLETIQDRTEVEQNRPPGKRRHWLILDPLGAAAPS